MNENLIIARVGDQTVHRNWLAEGRDWDLALSYYGSNPEGFVNDGDVPMHRGPGGKLEAIFELLTKEPHLLDGRRYIWVPDDDVDTDCATINKMFSLMREYDLKIAQPSICPTSFVNHKITATIGGREHSVSRQKPITAPVPWIILRYTSFVETMAPCFSIDVFRTLLPYFKGMRFGWGFDHLWSLFASENEMAVMDCINVHHSRKQGSGPLYSEGDPIAEMRRTMRMFNVSNLPNRVDRAALFDNGTVLRGRALKHFLYHS